MLYEAWLASENEMDSEAEEPAAPSAGTQVLFLLLKLLALLVQPYKH
jgi:hypothetical protein